MNPLDLLFGQIRGAIESHASPNTPGPVYEPQGILEQIAGIFGGHAQQHGGQFGGYDPNQVYSSNQDPFGDPGLRSGAQNVGYGNVASSDQDPYGDPGLLANNEGGGYGGVQSSDQDPYGDPGLQR